MRRIPGGAQTFSKMESQYACWPQMHRGIGCRVWDTEGKEYIDLSMGLGAVTLGHCHKEVDDYVKEAPFICPSLPHPLEGVLAEKLCEIIPCAEMVKYGKNGSDVTSAAVRLARHLTKRDYVACCGYHGKDDWYVSVIQPNGVPEVVRKLTRTFRYGDIDSLGKIIADSACVIMEPVSFNDPGEFLHEVREICDKYGTILIFDEIVTGFRFHLGGAQALFGVTPDLATFGKGMGNGYPISALVGKEKYMSRLNEVFYSTTFGGELTGISAAIKTIDIMQREDVIGHIWHMGSMLDLSGYPPWRKFEGDFSYMQQELMKKGILTRNTVFISYDLKEPDMREVVRAIESIDPNGKADKIIEPVIRDRMVDH